MRTTTERKRCSEHHQNSSRVAAACESPARKCGVKWNKYASPVGTIRVLAHTLHVAPSANKIRAALSRCPAGRLMAHGVLGGAVTVKLTVGPLGVVLMLLEATPLESTPTIVNVYVLAGVIPFGVVVDAVLVAHPGMRMKAPPSTITASMPHAPLRRFPLAAAPMPTSPISGKKSQKPMTLRECAPVVVGPNVLMVKVALAGVPFTGRFGFFCGYVNEDSG